MTTTTHAHQPQPWCTDHENDYCSAGRVEVAVVMNGYSGLSLPTAKALGHALLALVAAAEQDRP